MGARMAENVSYYIFTIVIATYAKEHLKLGKWLRAERRTDRRRDPLLRDPAVGCAVGPDRPQAGLPVRGDRRRHLGLRLRRPGGHEELRAGGARGHRRADPARCDVRAAGILLHRAVRHQGPVLRGVGRLPARLDHRRRAGAVHRRRSPEGLRLRLRDLRLRRGLRGDLDHRRHLVRRNRPPGPDCSRWHDPQMEELLRLLAEDAPGASWRGRPAGRGRPELACGSGPDEASKKREAELSALVDVARELASSPRSRQGPRHHRPPRPDADRHRRRLPHPVRRGARRHLHAGHRRIRVSRLPATATPARSRAGRTGRRDLQAVLDRRLPQPTTASGTPPRSTPRSGEEGLVAICGTPLIVDGAFVGVLFASNRTRRPFSREEVSLLGSLAALAAVTIVQVRAAAETAAALDQLSAAHAGTEHAAAAHDRFADIVLSGGDVDAIAAALAELLTSG